MRFFRKLRAFLRQRKLDAEMSEELRAHLEMQEAENRASGMSPEEARYAARRQFGGVEQVKEQARGQRGLVWLEEVGRDLRYAVRALRQAPSFAITAILTLAFGIGVNAALFTVYNIVALRPLPVRDPDALVKIAGQRRGAYYPGFSYAEYLAYRDGQSVLSGLAAVSEANLRLAREEGAVSDSLFQSRGPGVMSVQFVSENYFDVLGGAMALGRGFLPEENRAPGVAPVLVLSHLFWERQFNRDPGVIGRTLTVSGRVYTIVGVTAPEFVGQQPAPPAAWLPLMMWGRPEDYGPKGVANFRLIGRLQPGVTEAQAKSALDLVAARRLSEFPDDEAKDSVRLERGMRFVDVQLDARTLAAATPLLLGFGMVLVIACTNVANLLLARGVTRQQEIGVRLTLGASRWRVIRQLLTENLLICLVGGAVGLVLAIWMLQLLQPIVLGRLPADWAAETRRWYFLKVTPDWRMVGFTGVLALVAVVASGLLPALHAGSGGLISTLKNEGTIFGRRLSQSRLRALLVTVQVAVSVMLLSCAGLLARNLFELRRADVGFDPRRVFQASVSLRGRGMDPAARAAAMPTLRELPGVESASLASGGPLLGGIGNTILFRPDAAEAEAPVLKLGSYSVEENFFRTFGISLLRGRGFTPAETQAGARLAIVSESLARQFWPGENPVGKMVGINESAFAQTDARWSTTLVNCEVIGVAHDVMGNAFRMNRDRSVVYLPRSFTGGTTGALFLRPRSDSTPALSELARAADAAGLVLRFDRRLSDYLEDQMLPFTGLAALSGALGMLALLMASVGIYGVMAFGVNQRVREIGVRLALGATAEKVIALFLRQGMRLVAMGLVVGLGGGALFALLLSRVLSGLPGTFDPLAFGAVALLFSAVALFACWLPARRATKVDPMVALRCE